MASNIEISYHKITQRCRLFQLCVIYVTDALPGARYMGRNMLGSQRCRLFRLRVTCRRITSMLLLAPSGLAVPASRRLFQLCVFCLRHTRRFGLVPSVLSDVFFSCVFFAGVIHIYVCLPGAYPRSPRLGEVAECYPLNSALESMGCKCNRQSGLLPD